MGDKVQPLGALSPDNSEKTFLLNRTDIFKFKQLMWKYESLYRQHVVTMNVKDCVGDEKPSDPMKDFFLFKETKTPNKNGERKV